MLWPLTVNLSMATPSYIYESPDGGQTVYRRTIGNPHRELHHQDPSIRAAQEMREENQLWHNIRVAAMHNDQLAQLLEQAKIYYHLINEDSN